ncbi:hypothetical protein [Carboxylicivirga sp. N1Y90]|uniref:hypothetical protein n=1 Tax=Carboxylicivirga fragile TaxID=3417571 RepID=UPI003D3329B5|nr:hypothetical protein [Marinilabiliaceae bacterium N1Y90]
MLKIKLIFFPIMLSLSFFEVSSQDSKKDKLLENVSVFDCEIVTENSIILISDYLINGDLDSCDIVINRWENYCGGSEVLYRLRIYLALVQRQGIQTHVNLFFINDYSDKYLNRFYASQKNDYGNIYTENKAYFSYVPLRSKIDSILISNYTNLLEVGYLTTDEKIICLLFSGNEEAFEKKLKSAKKRESYLKQLSANNAREYKDHTMSYNLYTGFYKSIGKDNFFSYSPIIGFTFSTPLRYKLQVELGIKFRINQDSKNFDFNALGKTHNVSSDYSVFFGGLVGYKVIDKDHLKLIPKLGLGLESVSTGITEDVKNSDKKEYYDVDVPHLSLGIAALTPIFKTNYIGIELSYHYCPYHWDSSLISTFNNNLFSTELLVRF